jgi:hypothetical protein
MGMGVNRFFSSEVRIALKSIGKFLAALRDDLRLPEGGHDLKPGALQDHHFFREDRYQKQKGCD